VKILSVMEPVDLGPGEVAQPALAWTLDKNGHIEIILDGHQLCMV